MGDNFLGVLSQSLAMPVFLVFDFGEILAFESISDDGFWLVVLLSQLVQSVYDFIVVMAVDYDCFPPECFEFACNWLNIMTVHGLLGLTESVDINDGDKIVEFVVSAEINSLPNTALSYLSVSADTEYSVVDLIEIFTWIRHTTSDGKPLAQRSSGDIDERNVWNRVSFNDGVFQS